MTDNQSKQVFDAIDQLLSDNNIEEVISIPMIPVRYFEEILTENYGYQKLELNGDETNGWQVDFWYYFKHDTKPTIGLAGSLHYGEFRIYKDTDEDEQD